MSEDYPTRSIAHSYTLVGFFGFVFELFEENNHEATSPIIGIIRNKLVGRAVPSL